MIKVTLSLRRIRDIECVPAPEAPGPYRLSPASPGVSLVSVPGLVRSPQHSHQPRGPQQGRSL